MDLLKTATDWAKAEVFSSQFFILFGSPICIGKHWFLAIRKNGCCQGIHHSDIGSRHFTFGDRAWIIFHQ